MAKQPRVLYGQVVAITGGARGIGRATAQALVREGARVAIGDLDATLAAATAEEIGAAAGLALDVTDRASFAEFLDTVERDVGPLDVLVNNAGIMSVGRFEDEDDATAIRQMDINVHGVIVGMKLALQRMRPRHRGHIVNIASVAGHQASPGIATYAATKHAVVGLTESVRLELRGSGIESTAICPAPVATELFSGIDATGVLKPIAPEDVARAVVDALKVPEPQVFVPKSVGRLIYGLRVVPRAVAEGIGKALKADDVMLRKLDPGKRAAYEARAAQSEPGLAADAEPTAREPVSAAP